MDPSSTIFMPMSSSSSSTPSSHRSSLSTVVPLTSSSDADEEDSGEDDWVVVQQDWWKVPFNVVPWSYKKQYQWSLEGIRYPFHPKPLHTLQLSQSDDGGGLDISGSVHQGAVTVAGETGECAQELSIALAGVSGAEDVIGQYESDVGIQLPCSPSFQPLTLAEAVLPSQFPQKVLLFNEEPDDDELALAQQRWDDQVRSLLHGITQRVATLDLSFEPPVERCKLWDLDKIDDILLSSSLGSSDVDLTDSELSAESELLPSTPHTDKKSYAAAVFDETNIRSSSLPASSFLRGKVISPSPAKPLSASALSFIPASTVPHSSSSPSPSPSASPLVDSHHSHPYTSPTYEFHFPSLTSNADPSTRSDTRSLPPTLQKDQEGFYYSETVPTTSPSSTSNSSAAARSHTSTRTATPRKEKPSGSLLPAFLTEGSTPTGTTRSKTREMVNRLRTNVWPERKKNVKTDFVAKNLFLGLDLNTNKEGGVVEDGKVEEQAAGVRLGSGVGAGMGGGRPGAVTFESQADKLAAIDGWITSVENEAIAAEHQQTLLQSQGLDGWIEGMTMNKFSTPPRANVNRSSRSVATHQNNKHSRSTSTSTRTTSSSGGSGGSALTPTTPSSSSVSSSSNATTTFPSPASSMTSFGACPTTPSSTSVVGFGGPSPTTSSTQLHPSYGPYPNVLSAPSTSNPGYGPMPFPPTSNLPYPSQLNPVQHAQAQAAYMQMQQFQMQMQAQAQAQWQQQMHMQGHGHPQAPHPFAGAGMGMGTVGVGVGGVAFPSIYTPPSNSFGAGL